MNNEYNIVGLYDHNVESYNTIKESFREDDIVAIVHATGTGKTYNALQLAYDNKDKKIVYVVPSNGIIEHIKRIIENNPRLDFEKDFVNLEFRTYQSFINMDRKEIEEMDIDMLILDEFHHIGAPVWGARINTIIETHSNIKVFGMTAYTVRDRGTPYERDMTDPDTDELFSNKVVSRYDLCDAMIDGVLPKPIYKSAYVNLIGMESELEKKLEAKNITIAEKNELKKILNDVKKKIHEDPSMAEVVKRNIKPNGKYIYFCPPRSEDNVNDIKTIMEEAKKWVLEMELSEDDIVFYQTTSEMGKDGKLNREAFYNDVTLAGEKIDNKLRIMFAINQYNEGIHAPNIDGVIMGRGTTSDIVYFEQLGRALAVRGENREKLEEYEKCSIEELLKLCQDRDIQINDVLDKDEIIDKLLAPVIIDLTNNFEFIKNLENNLKDRIKEIQSLNGGKKREIKLRDASFDIEIENQNLYEMLRYVVDRLTKTWEDMYEYAKAYYEHHGNLLVSSSFKTINGCDYDENGIALGNWVHRQNNAKNNGKLVREREKLLNEIGMVWVADGKITAAKWQENYELAKKYYEQEDHLLIPKGCRVLLIGDELEIIDKKDKRYKEAIQLGEWIKTQRRVKRNGNMNSQREKLLSEIGMVWVADDKTAEEKWQENYELAKKYYEQEGHLLVPALCRVLLIGDKLEIIEQEDERYEEANRLGIWISHQRTAKKSNNIKPQREYLLNKIGMVWVVDEKTYDEKWQENYELAKKYYEQEGHLLIPNGCRVLVLGDKLEIIEQEDERYDKAKQMGRWIKHQRQIKKNGKMAQERENLLNEIGMVWGVDGKITAEKWQKNYELAKKYYEQEGHLLIPNGCRVLVIGDQLEIIDKKDKRYKEAKRLGEWINSQRAAKKGQCTCKMTEERENLLNEIGMVWVADDKIAEEKWQKKYELAKKYYEQEGHLLVPNGCRVLVIGDQLEIIDKKDKRYKEAKRLGEWINSQRAAKKGQCTYKMTEEREYLLNEIGMIWDAKTKKQELSDLCNQYGINTKMNKSILGKSYKEVYSKIMYLLENNIALYSENGILHEIFFMSDTNMKEKYGVSLSILLNTYKDEHKKEI